MSGSPVFLVRKQGPATLAELVEVAVRELRSAGIIASIPTGLLVSALDVGPAKRAAQAAVLSSLLPPAASFTR